MVTLTTEICKSSSLPTRAVVHANACPISFFRALSPIHESKLAVGGRAQPDLKNKNIAPEEQAEMYSDSPTLHCRLVLDIQSAEVHPVIVNSRVLKIWCPNSTLISKVSVPRLDCIATRDAEYVMGCPSS